MLSKKRIFVTILILLFILFVWIIWGNVTVGVTRYTVTSDCLPHSFDGYKIAVVSDLHNAQFGNDNSQLVGGIIAPDQGLFPEFDAGKYSNNHTTMIVSRGIGNSIIPVRINNRPEIVIVELMCD